MAILAPPRYIVAMGEATAPGRGQTAAEDPAQRWVRVRRALPWVAIGIAVALNYGSLSHGLQVDDNVYTALIGAHLEGRSSGAWYEIASLRNPGGPAGISAMIDAGQLPWWSDPQLKWALFRPLAVASHFIDMMWWPGSPITMHVHNLCWYAALLLSVLWLYRRCDPEGPAGVAGLTALCFYAFNVTNGAVASWIATRNAIMTALFVVLCVGFHDLARRRPPGTSAALHGLSCIALMLGLLSSEGAIAAWGYLVAHALWLDEGPLRGRVRSLLPALLTTLLWNAGYRAMDFGTAGGGLYLDPVVEPTAFALVLPERMWWLMHQLLGLPAGLDVLHPALPLFSQVLAAVGLALLCLWSLPDRRMRFWIGGCIASMIPWCAGYPTYRMLLIPAIGAFGALGYAVASIARRRPMLVASLPAKLRPAAGGGLLVLMVLWVTLHVPVGAALVPQLGQERQRLEHILDSLAASMPPDEAGKSMMLLNTPSFVMTLFATFYRADDPFQTRRAYTLGANDRAVLLSRPKPNSLRLLSDGGYLAELTSRLPRSLHNRFASGDSVSMGPARVTVETVTSDGRPLQVRFDFDDLEDPGLLWTAVHWRGAELVARRIELPAVGGSLVLPAVVPP